MKKIAVICGTLLAVALVATGCVPARPVEERVRLSDVEQALNTVAVYSFGVDGKDIDKVMGVFTDDAHVVCKEWGWDARGKEEVRNLYLDIIKTWDEGRHNPYNFYFEVKGDKLTSTHYWYWHAKDAATGAYFAGEGKYDREFVQEDGVWKIRYQEIIPEWFQEVEIWP